ncbi:extended synaptotagmin-2-like isoform X3 [Mizuhopecten yessoensis]|uniref:extended synaptotagmin-2-like isoform X3 n=1 Tax=Mizuhopecten yessoensis TaxID=6573 RepID=UPI000B45B89A|nr:extended synaptotagmin-2-like isoform X3 [Mizuhopecten yessoensis]
MPDDKKTAAAKKKAADETQLLPVILRYFKLAGVALTVYGFGYTQFSPSWILIGLVAYVWKEKYTQRRQQQIKTQQLIAKDEASTILARVEDLPSWVHFPDVERAEWFNKILDQIWPFIGDYVKKLLMDSIQEKIQQSHSTVGSFRFTQIDLGDIPPRIGGVKVYTENVRRDEIYLDLDIIYSSDSFIEVKVKGITAGIKDLQLRGTLRVIFKPLIGQIPLFGGMSFFFINTPDIDFNLTGLANSLDLPGLSDMLDTIIAEQISNIMVLPNRIVVPMVQDINLMLLRYPQPDGVLRIHVLGAKDLIRADIGFAKKGKSDPYAVIKVGAKKFKTKVINNTINPEWNAVFETIIDIKDGQYVDIELKDEDPGSKDDDLGCVNIALASVAKDGMTDSWLPLEDVKQGLIHIKLVWNYLSKDPSILDHTLQHLEKNTDGTELSSSLLMVNLDSARELPYQHGNSFGLFKRGKKQMAEPSSYCIVSVGQMKEESAVKLNTDSPIWEENYRYLVHDPNIQVIDIQVMDKKTGKPLGDMNLPLKSVLRAPDMTLDQYFSLKNSGPSSQVHMRLALRALTTEKSKESTEPEQIITPSKATKDGTSVDGATAAAAPAASTQAAAPKDQKAAPAKATTPTAAKDTGKQIVAETVSSVQSIPPAKTGTPQQKTDTELRHRKATSPTPAAPNPKGAHDHGRMNLTIRYSVQRSQLVVVIHKCVHLIACDDDHLADPYVKMYLLPDKSAKHKTKTVKDSLNPVFDETFEFEVKQDEVKQKTLDITVRNDTSMFSGNKKTMGTLEISLANLDLTKFTTEWFDVRPEDFEGKPYSLCSDV